MIKIWKKNLDDNYDYIEDVSEENLTTRLEELRLDGEIYRAEIFVNGFIIVLEV